MTFNFFTFGGIFFWEDIFFYQKWRIQRNCITGHYRLLDSWDIRRESGSFEDCQKAFASYINIYELKRQSQSMIILLHGYMDNKSVFKRLWRKLVMTNSTVVALNYPTLFRDTLASAHQLLFFLNHIDDVQEISFVTKGIGNMVLQKALSFPPEMQTFRNNARINRIVQINPVIKASLLCEFLTRFKVFRFLLGPSITDMTERGIKNLPRLPDDSSYLKIFSESKTYKILVNILNYFRFPVEESNYKGKNAIYITGKTFKTLNNEEILIKTVKFLKSGKI